MVECWDEIRGPNFSDVPKVQKADWAKIWAEGSDGTESTKPVETSEQLVMNASCSSSQGMSGQNLCPMS